MSATPSDPAPLSEPPDGYQEIGETLALAVVEGGRSQRWAKQIASLLGYRGRDVTDWLRWYKQVNPEAGAEQSPKRRRQGPSKREQLKQALAEMEQRRLEQETLQASGFLTMGPQYRRKGKT